MIMFDELESKVNLWVDAYNEALNDYKKFPCEKTENALRAALIMLSDRTRIMNYFDTDAWYREV